MKQKEMNPLTMNRVLRDFILEASEQELLEALEGAGENFDSLACKGKTISEKAINNADSTGGAF